MLALEAQECSVKHVRVAVMHPLAQFLLLRVPSVVGKEYSHLPSDLSSGGDGDEQNLLERKQLRSRIPRDVGGRHACAEGAGDATGWGGQRSKTAVQGRLAPAYWFAFIQLAQKAAKTRLAIVFGDGEVYVVGRAGVVNGSSG